ncbi:hypothetical protein J3459_010288 [Metarhizium acridum]|nr:hypothetical protein J3459_010288 [Metarhizium acridum]
MALPRPQCILPRCHPVTSTITPTPLSLASQNLEGWPQYHPQHSIVLEAYHARHSGTIRDTVACTQSAISPSPTPIALTTPSWYQSPYPIAYFAPHQTLSVLEPSGSSFGPGSHNHSLIMPTDHSFEDACVTAAERISRQMSDTQLQSPGQGGFSALVADVPHQSSALANSGIPASNLPKVQHDGASKGGEKLGMRE